MLVVSHNAEEALLADLDVYVGSSEDCRCAWLKLAAFPADVEEVLLRLEPVLHGLYVDSVPKVYVFQSRDVFVIMKGVNYKQLEPVEALLETGERVSEESPLELFDMRVDRARLYAVVRRQSAVAHQKREEEVLRKKEAYIHEQVKTEIARFDPEWVVSLGARRRERKKLEVMVVEDDVLPRMLITHMLQAHCNVTGAVNGIEAVGRFIAQAPDVVFLDIGLPGMDGYHVLQSVFELDPEAYVVMLSAHTSEETMRRALAFGAQGFIRKPFNYNKLCRYINLSPHVQKKHQAVGASWC